MISKSALNKLYLKYNRREYIHPDPLEFLYDYPDPSDREIVGLIASSLAYGRVAQILKSVEKVLEPMGESPRFFIEKTTRGGLSRIYRGFKHRFTTDADLVSLLDGIRRVIIENGSLNSLFLRGENRKDTTVLPALSKFVKGLDCEGNYLIPSPERGSACKRLNLFLRWMVREDVVDPGGWGGVSPSKLIIPLDTHMSKIGRELGMTKRKSADMKMALEITDFFRKIAPRDPVKYDFALTRFGIRDELELGDLLNT